MKVNIVMKSGAVFALTFAERNLKEVIDGLVKLREQQATEPSTSGCISEGAKGVFIDLNEVAAIHPA